MLATFLSVTLEASPYKMYEGLIWCSIRKAPVYAFFIFLFNLKFAHNDYNNGKA